MYSKGGYDRRYEVGNAPGGVIPTRCDGASVLGYCYHGTPIDFNMTGIRSFVAATAGTIYEQLNDGNEIVCSNGARIPPGSPASPIS
jgi:hypothetical protein